MSKRKIISIILLVLSIILAVISIIILPSEVAIQISASGEANTVVTKYLAIVITTLLGCYSTIKMFILKDDNGYKDLIVSGIALLLFAFLFIFNL